MNNAHSKIVHAVANFDGVVMGTLHHSLRCLLDGIRIPYVPLEADPLGHVIWEFLTPVTEVPTLRKYDIRHLNALKELLGTPDVEISIGCEFIPADAVMVFEGSKLAFLEAFTNACKYGDYAFIANHMHAPVITMTNNISKTRKGTSRGFGLSGFSDKITKNQLGTDDAYLCYITNQ
jgi:hypothetical protein